MECVSPNACNNNSNNTSTPTDVVVTGVGASAFDVSRKDEIPQESSGTITTQGSGSKGNPISNNSGAPARIHVPSLPLSSPAPTLVSTLQMEYKAILQKQQAMLENSTSGSNQRPQNPSITEFNNNLGSNGQSVLRVNGMQDHKLPNAIYEVSDNNFGGNTLIQPTLPSLPTSDPGTTDMSSYKLREGSKNSRSPSFVSDSGDLLSRVANNYTETTHDIARRKLYKHLRNGICVFLYGPTGKPKREILNCDSDATILIWLPEFDPSDLDEDDIREPRNVQISDIQGIQLGIDIDPATPSEVLLEAAATNQLSQIDVLKTLELKQRRSLVDDPAKPKSNGTSWFFAKEKEKGQILYGTEELRKYCPPDQLELALAIYLPDRTLSVLCQSRKDFDGLTKNLKVLLDPCSIVAHPSNKVNRDRTWSGDSIDTNLDGDSASKSSKSRVMREIIPSSSGGQNKYGSYRKSFADFYDSIDTTLIESTLAEQDRVYGVNMYTSLRPGDEIVIQNYLLRGYPLDGALHRLFSKRYEPHSASRRPSFHAESMPRFRIPSQSNSFVDHVFTRTSIRNVKARDVFTLGAMLLQQERDYGVNMFESITPDDDEAYSRALESGIPHEQAVLEVFNNKISRGVISLQSHDQVQEDIHSVVATFAGGNIDFMNHSFQEAPIPTFWPQDQIAFQQYPPQDPMTYQQYPSQPAHSMSYAAQAPIISGMITPALPNQAVPQSTMLQPNSSFYGSVPTYQQQSPAHPTLQHTQSSLYSIPQVPPQQRPPPPSYAPAPPPVTSSPGPSSSIKAISVQALPAATDSPRQPRELPRSQSTLSWLFSGSGGGSVDPRCKSSDINRIMEMGFSRDQAVSALMVNDFNLARAIDSLTSSY